MLPQHSITRSPVGGGGTSWGSGGYPRPVLTGYALPLPGKIWNNTLDRTSDRTRDTPSPERTWNQRLGRDLEPETGEQTENIIFPRTSYAGFNGTCAMTIFTHFMRRLLLLMTSPEMKIFSPGTKPLRSTLRFAPTGPDAQHRQQIVFSPCISPGFYGRNHPVVNPPDCGLFY